MPLWWLPVERLVFRLKPPLFQMVVLVAMAVEVVELYASQVRVVLEVLGLKQPTTVSKGSASVLRTVEAVAGF
jgi:hypothetical protein